jgi:hypothetical protein
MDIQELTYKLTMLKLEKTPNLCVENFAADLYAKLLEVEENRSKQKKMTFGELKTDGYFKKLPDNVTRQVLENFKKPKNWMAI